MGFSNWINCKFFSRKSKSELYYFSIIIASYMYFLCKEKQHCQWKVQWIKPFCSEVPTFCEELVFIYLSIFENIKQYPSWVGNKQISGVYTWRQCHFGVADISVDDRDNLCKSHWCYIGILSSYNCCVWKVGIH